MNDTRTSRTQVDNHTDEVAQPPRGAADVVGRAASQNPANRFERLHCEDDFEQLAEDDQLLAERRSVATEFFDDRSQSILSTNNSPDIPFRYSINPYRGCEHGCAYCYARPTHEMLGWGAGLDFETRVLVKRDAARLLRDALCKPSWQGEQITISGVTDCYQVAERRFRITRSLLEVMLEARQCVGIITKNALVLRDLDLLSQLAERRLVRVFISITTLDASLTGTLEPRTSRPHARLKAVRALTAAGVPTGVMVAPIIPGLTDHEMPAILAAAAEAGAVTAGYTLLRLPLSVEPVFRQWLARHYPDQQGRIESLIRSARGGELSDARFGTRMRGSGLYAEQIAQTFGVFARRHGLDRRMPPFDTTQFRRPRGSNGQLSLF